MDPLGYSLKQTSKHLPRLDCPSVSPETLTFPKAYSLDRRPVP